MNRNDFYGVVRVNDVDELDHLNSSLSLIKLKREVRYYRVLLTDLMRPDMISWRAYGTVEHWWVICLVNKIENPLTELQEGQRLILPDLLDISDARAELARR